MNIEKLHITSLSHNALFREMQKGKLVVDDKVYKMLVGSNTLNVNLRNELVNRRRQLQAHMKSKIGVIKNDKTIVAKPIPDIDGAIEDKGVLYEKQFALDVAFISIMDSTRISAHQVMEYVLAYGEQLSSDVIWEWVEITDEINISTKQWQKQCQQLDELVEKLAKKEKLLENKIKVETGGES